MIITRAECPSLYNYSVAYNVLDTIDQRCDVAWGISYRSGDYCPADFVDLLYYLQLPPHYSAYQGNEVNISIYRHVRKKKRWVYSEFGSFD